MSSRGLDSGISLNNPQTRGLKRSREGENFDSLLQKIQDNYGIQLAAEARQMAWSPSKRANDLGKCLTKMRQLYWRSPDMLAQRLELFENLDNSQHTLKVLLSVVGDQNKSGGPSPTKMFMEYRSSSGEDTEATSHTVSPSEGSLLTAPTERSPPSPILPTSYASNSPTKRGKSVVDDGPQHYSSDFDTDLDISQLITDTAHLQNEDVWLRRRSSPPVEETELDYAINEQAQLAAYPELPELGNVNNVDPAWISTCPLMSQTEVGKGQLYSEAALTSVAEGSEEKIIDDT